MNKNHSEPSLNKWNQVFDSIKYHFKEISNEEVNFNDDFNKIKFISDNSLRLDKLIYFPTLTVIIKCVFKQGDLFYPQVYLDDALHQLYMISYEKIDEYNNKKEGVKCMMCNLYCFKDNLNYQPYVCNKCHDFSMTVMNLSDFFVLNIKSNNYRVYISNIDKK